MGLYGTIAIERNIFGESRNFRKCNCTSACLISLIMHVMIIHSHKKHISLQILHWTHNDVVVQCSFTRVCQGVPNKMLGASYTNRDVSSFQTRDLYCNGRNMYNCPTFFLFWKCLDDMSYWTNLYRTVADNELHFFTISNLNYTVFVSLAHHT